MDKKEQRRRQFHARGGGDTPYHLRVRASIDKKNEYLLKRGWVETEGGMLISPYTQLKYPRYIARDVEDLRYYFRVSERRGRDDFDVEQGKVPTVRTLRVVRRPQGD